MREMPVATSQVDRFLGALFSDAPSGLFIELRWRHADGMRRAFCGVDALADARNALAEHAAATDVYVGVLPRARKGGTRADLVQLGQVLWADCDTPGAVVSLLRFKPPPSVVVHSGTDKHRHAYWLLSENVSMDGLEAANRRLAQALGADLACAEAARILRPPSLNHKHQPPTRVHLESCDSSARYRLDDVVGGLPPLPEPWLPGRSRCAPRISDDPLLAIAPARYVEGLTGIQVPRSGKVRCPFHPDDTPSLHVYREPRHGWYCYGCCRGGSIYDFASLLWLSGQSSGGRAGWKLKGREFLWVRQRVAEMFLGEHAESG